MLVSSFPKISQLYLKGIVKLGKSLGQCWSLCAPRSVRTPTTFEILDKYLLPNENSLWPEIVPVHK